MNIFELTPINGRKSFYGKAKVILENGIASLISYNTKVAEYNESTGTMTVNGWYSKTTTSHINAFLQHYGFEACTKQELENYNKTKS